MREVRLCSKLRVFSSEREGGTVFWLEIVMLGLGVGVLVGLMGVGGGIVLVPALVYVAGMSQHLAQGTSLFLQLPPIGIGALMTYWKNRQVDLRAGCACAAGFLSGGYFGSYVAVERIRSDNDLRGFFGLFLMVAAVMLIRQTSATVAEAKNNE